MVVELHAVIGISFVLKLRMYNEDFNRFRDIVERSDEVNKE